MKAFITGASGYLGRQVAIELLQRDVNVICLVRRRTDIPRLRQLAGVRSAQLDFVEGTLTKPASFAEAMSDCDAVYHVAAAMKGATAVLFQNNVVATRQLALAARQQGVSRLVLISSLAVYGSQSLPKNGLLDETCPLDPQPHLRDPYTYSKHAQESAVREVAESGGPAIVIIRPGVIYGPGRDCITSRVGLQVGGVLIRMGGRQFLPYTYVDNCAEAIALAGLTAGIDGEAFNIVDDDPPTAGQLLRHYKREIGGLRSVRVPHMGIIPLSRMCQWYSGFSRGQLPAVLTAYKSSAMWKRLRYSNAKAKRMLNWAPRVGFDEGLRNTFAALREMNKLQGLSA